LSILLPDNLPERRTEDKTSTARRELTVGLAAFAMQSVARSRAWCATVGSAMPSVVAWYTLNPVITRVIGNLKIHRDGYGVNQKPAAICAGDYDCFVFDAHVIFFSQASASDGSL
jgi:hypothetical protein